MLRLVYFPPLIERSFFFLILAEKRYFFNSLSIRIQQYKVRVSLVIKGGVWVMRMEIFQDVLM